MAFKILIQGNALVVEDSVTGEVFIDEPSKNVYYIFEKVKGGKDTIHLVVKDGSRSRVTGVFDSPLSNTVDLNDVVFTKATWETFARTNLGGGGSGGTTGDFLDKVTLDAQTVAGPVEFLQDITVPSGSVVLGRDGAKLSSAGRSLHYTDARLLPTLYAEYHYDDTGSEVPHYLEWGALQTNFPVNPDDDGTVLSTSNMAFVGALGASATLAFYVKPLTIGVLRLQIWEGSDDTGAVLIDIAFNITGAYQNMINRFEFPVPLITESGDMQFVRFTGVDLSGAVQTNGAFIGELQPFMEFDVQLLTQKDLATTDDLTGLVDEAPEDGKQYARKDAGWAEVEGDGIGDMLKATYDPNTVEGDAFDMDNMVEGVNTKIMTDTERADIAGNTSAIMILAPEVALNSAKVSFPEAPNDGQEYVRKSENWAVATKAYAEIYAGSDLIQSPAVDDILVFDTNGVSLNCTADQANNRITITIAGDYNIRFEGGADIKRDKEYTVKVFKNGSLLRNIVCNESGDDEYKVFAGGLLSTLAVDDYLQIAIDSTGSNKFDICTGTRLYVEKIK